MESRLQWLLLGLASPACETMWVQLQVVEEDGGQTGSFHTPSLGRPPGLGLKVCDLNPASITGCVPDPGGVPPSLGSVDLKN
jgi:hypothetical protein